jgi:hypothetical protein
MSIFKKILGGKTPAAIQTPETPSTAESRPLSRRSRMIRVRVDPAMECYFVQGEGADEIRVPVLNLSGSGMALAPRSQSGPFAPALGTEIEGVLSLRGKSQPVRLVVVRNTAELVGCAYHAPHDSLTQLVLRGLRVELAAYALTRVDSKYLKKEPDGTFACFRGPDENELRLVEKDGVILRFTLIFFDWQIQGGAGTALRYSKTGRESKDEGLHYDYAPLMHEQSEAPAPVRKLAMYLVSLIPGLEPGLAAQLQGLLSGV